jgi:hypothetical protein
VVSQTDACEKFVAQSVNNQCLDCWHRILAGKPIALAIPDAQVLPLEFSPADFSGVYSA